MQRDFNYIDFMQLPLKSEQPRSTDLLVLAAVVAFVSVIAVLFGLALTFVVRALL